MYREIEKKMDILEKRRPFSTEVRQWIQERDRKELVFFDLKMEGSGISREDIEGIFRDELVKTASIQDYAFLKRHRLMLEQMRFCLDVENTLNQDVLLKLYSSLMDGETAEYRKSNALLPELHYVPVHQMKIQSELELLFRGLGRQQNGSVLEKAAFLHNQLIVIYPFEEYNLVLARMAMNYYLAENGYPMVILGYSRDEYLDAVGRYLRHKDMLPFYHGLERAMYNKLEILIQATEGSLQ